MLRDTIKKILILGRLQFLAGGLLLFLMGSFLAIIDGAMFDLGRLFFAYMIMLPAHLGLSYSNNYFDVSVDQYGTPNVISGGTWVLVENPQLKKFTKYFAILLMMVSFTISIIFICVYNISILFFGFVVFGNLLGWFYSAPPIRLAYHGLGEIANMLTMGILMPGIGFWGIQGTLSFSFLIIMIPFLLYGLYFIITVELPDVEIDQKGHKHTLLVKHGRHIGYLLILIVSLLSTLYFISLSIIPLFEIPINFQILSILSTLPLAIAILGLKSGLRQALPIKTWALIQMAAIISLLLLINIYFLVLIL